MVGDYDQAEFELEKLIECQERTMAKQTAAAVAASHSSIPSSQPPTGFSSQRALPIISDMDIQNSKNRLRTILDLKRKHAPLDAYRIL
jgi:hypothetical protein